MLSISTIPVTPFVQNCRILSSTESSEVVVIDPGGDVPQIMEQLRVNGWECSQIWLTHSHIDHCAGVKELKALTGARLIGHRLGQPHRQSIEQIAQLYGFSGEGVANCPEPDQYIDHGDRLSVTSQKEDSKEWQVLYTPGHAPGHVCFYHQSEGVLIGGDAIFAGSIGRTDLPGGDHATLIRSIKEQILSLPDETRVLSGHGPDTTVGGERLTNPFLI